MSKISDKNILFLKEFLLLATVTSTKLTFSQICSRLMGNMRNTISYFSIMLYCVAFNYIETSLETLKK